MEYSPGSEAAAALTGDYVGVESCVDLRNEVEFEAYVRDCERSYERRRRRKREAVVGDRERRRSEVREFPPPITYLARTENLPSRVMKRYYTADGRLVIKEEKVRLHEYFRAHRADGRLTLQLVPMDSYIDCGTEVVNEEEEDEVVVVDEEVVAPVMMSSSVSMAALCITEGVKSGGMLTSASSSSIAPNGGGTKCYGFNSLRSSSASSLFHLQVPAIRPVIS